MRSKNTSRQSSTDDVPRRKLFSWLWRAVALLACIEVGWLTGSIFRSREKRAGGISSGPSFVNAGMVGELRPGEVKAVPQGSFYLVCRQDGSLMALSRTCTHLGCSIPWVEEKQQFICPCHGSTFDREGVVLTAPAIRPLDYYRIKIENGLIRVDVSHPLRRDSFDVSQTARA